MNIFFRYTVYAFIICSDFFQMKSPKPKTAIMRKDKNFMNQDTGTTPPIHIF